MREELTFWLAIGLVAVVAVVVFKVAAASDLGERIPGLRELADFI